jgi:hypothetical protein
MKVKEKDREYIYKSRRAKEWGTLKNIEGGQ